MTQEMILTNANIITRDDEFFGTVRVLDGLIADIERGCSSMPNSIDFEGDYLIPGIIELHTDNLEKHLIPRPKVKWPSVAAVISHDTQLAGAGITTVFDALAIGDVSSDGSRLQYLGDMVEALKIAHSKKMLRVDHFFHLRCEVIHDQILEIVSPYTDEPRVGLVSLMDHTPGQRQFVKLDKWYTYYQGRYGLNDDEMQKLLEKRKSGHEKYAGKHRKALAKLCTDREIPMATHDDATEEHIQEAAELGTVICEFPTTIDAAIAAHNKGMKVLMGAPNLVRGGSHSGNVSAMELAQKGLLDILSSDYFPLSLLHGAFILHEQGQFTLPEAIASVTVNSADAVGLNDRGLIEVGKRADLLRVRKSDEMPIIRGVWREGERIS